MKQLVIHVPDRPKQTIELESDKLTLGRAHTNDLCYPEDASLSRRHLEFSRAENGWCVSDLGSKNGTLLNGRRFSESQTLRAGDRISAGRITLVFTDPEDREALDRRVDFYGGPEAEHQLSGATVMTSLEGLLSGEMRPVTTSLEPSEEKVAVSGGDFRSGVVGALLKAGRELVGDRPLAELFQLILELSIESVEAERGVLMTLEGDDLTVGARHGEGFRISTAVRDRVLKDKSSVLVRDTLLEKAFGARESISEQNIRTMMAVPLQTEKRVIGLIYVDSRFFVRDFTPGDLNLLTVLANVAAIRIEHARLAEVEKQERMMHAELQQAARIQEGILPAEAPRIQGIELVGHNAPCHTVGGDYFDFLEYPDGRVGVVLGDVAGKGLPAALLMTSLQARVQILSELEPNLAALVHRLDRSIAKHCPRNRFITLFFGIVTPATGELSYCNAGHNPPLIVRADGTVELLEGSGTVLGILPELGYEHHDFQLGAGDILAVFSDGITEAQTPDEIEFGDQRLGELISSHRTKPLDELMALIHDRLDEWTDGAPPADDVTLVLARRSA